MSNSKGKRPERTSIDAESLEHMLEEAIDTSLPPPIEEYTPISPPPQAHYPSTMGTHLRPRLLSNITRSTLPTASTSYASASRRPSAQYSYPHAESSESARRRSLSFPDLDPTTGLPLGFNEVEAKQDELQLQRTITDLLKAPRPSVPSFGMPSLSMSLPSVNVGLPKIPDLGWSKGRRSMSTSSSQQDWGWGWWTGNKGKVDRMMSEEDQADTVEEEREKHSRKCGSRLLSLTDEWLKSQDRTPKHPMVFCHGLLGFDYIGPTSLPPLQISHWRGIREVLESNGVDVLITRVPATASVADRAAILAETISEKYKGREVNLIGHSMGGLDCRYLASELNPQSFKIKSVTTISTPHRGSPFADYVIDNVVGRERLPSLLGILESFKLPQSGDGSAFASLGTKAMKEFNTQVVDNPEVQYYSWGASFEPGLLDTFKWPHSVILAKEGPNDGLVSVQSAQWGEYRGTLLDVNHLDLVGWVNHVRYAIAGWTGRPITFKPATFYLEISDYLAEQGF